MLGEKSKVKRPSPVRCPLFTESPGQMPLGHTERDVVHHVIDMTCYCTDTKSSFLQSTAQLQYVEDSEPVTRST